MPLPNITPEQRAAALVTAARVRRERSDVKHRLKRGDVTLSQVIADPSAAVAKMKVTALLTAMPGVGPVRAAQIMGRLGIAEGRRVRGLGPHQRKALGEEFETALA